MATVFHLNNAGAPEGKEYVMSPPGGSEFNLDHVTNTINEVFDDPDIPTENRWENVEGRLLRSHYQFVELVEVTV